MSLVDTLIKESPQLHILAEDDQLHDFHSNTDLLKDLQGLASPNSITIETGCGWSTVVFAGSGTRHVCIAPHVAEVDLVKQYCSGQGINLANVQFITNRSELALPTLSSELMADIALIDGRHAFPTPIIDWFYLSRHLKIGGTIVIDDIDIRSCQIVYRFMESDPHWQLIKKSDNYALFNKVGDDSAVEWWRQQRFSQNKIGGLGPLEQIKFKAGQLFKHQR